MKGLTGKPRKRIGKKRAALIITALVFLAITGLGFAGLFRFLEYKSYDLRVKLLAPYSRPSDEIMVILLDQDSIDWARQERGWSWPWPRRAYAEILDYMNLGGANSVAFDVIFSEPSIYQETDDAAFARAERDFGRAAQTVVFSSRTGNTASWPGGLNKPLFELRGFEDIIGEYEKLNQNDEGFDRNAEAAGTIKAQFPIEEIRNAAGIIGSVTGWPDSDHIFRRTNLFSVWDGKAVPGLSAASLLVSGHDNTITFNKQKQLIEWGDWVIPVDKNGRSILRFRGELDRYIPYRARDILRSKEAWETGTTEALGGAYLPPEDFAGK
jgi:adenylate cyclase